MADLNRLRSIGKCPKPPLEASGTSGMKAARNGVPSLSVLDGWWIEGCTVLQAPGHDCVVLWMAVNDCRTCIDGNPAEPYDVLPMGKVVAELSVQGEPAGNTSRRG